MQEAVTVTVLITNAVLGIQGQGSLIRPLVVLPTRNFDENMDIENSFRHCPQHAVGPPWLIADSTIKQQLDDKLTSVAENMSTPTSYRQF